MRPVEYNNLRALSQSSIKMISYNPRLFYEREERWLRGEIEKEDDYSTTRALDLGSITDCIILTPEIFYEQYFVANSSIVPSGQMLTYTNYLYNKLQELDTSDYTQFEQDAYDHTGFKREKFETVKDRFATEGKPYLEYLLSNKGKVMIHEEDFSKAIRLKEEALSHEFVSKVFQNDYEKRAQVCVQGEIEGELFKGLMDYICIDHEKKVIRPYELKTSSESYFPKAYYKYRYDIQQNVYEILIENWRDQNFPDYRIVPITFIVLNTTENSKHGLWINRNMDFSKPTRNIKLDNGMTLEGLGDFIDRYKWHRGYNKWNHPKEVYEQEGFNLISL